MKKKPMFISSYGRRLFLQKPIVMGVLNVTPDSFSDGGKYANPRKAVEKALAMVEEGVDIIDIGGESTGPDSKNVSVAEELSRVMPVILELRAKTKSWLSIDTYKADVAVEALEAGVDMVNDVTALRGDPKMGKLLAGYDVPVVLMYSKDPTPRTTRKAVAYRDVVSTVKRFLSDRIKVAIHCGIQKERLVVDPGMGAFLSLNPKYSLQVIRRLSELQSFHCPVLVGPSRKSFIGQVLNLPLHERVEGTLAACVVAVMNGASILRVHDVKETRRVVDMVHAIIHS